MKMPLDVLGLDLESTPQVMGGNDRDFKLIAEHLRK
jgi:hypothetical protein